MLRSVILVVAKIETARILRDFELRKGDLATIVTLVEFIHRSTFQVFEAAFVSF